MIGLESDLESYGLPSTATAYTLDMVGNSEYWWDGLQALYSTLPLERAPGKPDQIVFE